MISRVSKFFHSRRSRGKDIPSDLPGMVPLTSQPTLDSHSLPVIEPKAIPNHHNPGRSISAKLFDLRDTIHTIKVTTSTVDSMIAEALDLGNADSLENPDASNSTIESLDLYLADLQQTLKAVTELISVKPVAPNPHYKRDLAPVANVSELVNKWEGRNSFPSNSSYIHGSTATELLSSNAEVSTGFPQETQRVRALSSVFEQGPRYPLEDETSSGSRLPSPTFSLSSAHTLSECRIIDQRYQSSPPTSLLKVDFAEDIYIEPLRLSSRKTSESMSRSVSSPVLGPPCMAALHLSTTTNPRPLPPLPTQSSSLCASSDRPFDNLSLATRPLPVPPLQIGSCTGPISPSFSGNPQNEPSWSGTGGLTPGEVENTPSGRSSVDELMLFLREGNGVQDWRHSRSSSAQF